MQIKFNKLKPSAKSEEPKATSPVQQSTAQTPVQNPVQAKVPPQQTEAPKMNELPNPPKAEQIKAAPTPAPAVAPAPIPVAPAPAAPVAPVEEPAAAPAPTASPVTPVSLVPPVPPIIPVESRPAGVRIEDTLKQFLNKQVRVYMVDHESVTGRLDIVEDGWIKMCNARSAGSDYYFDEEIINTVNIVRVHVSLNVGKEKYVEFMSEANKL